MKHWLVLRVAPQKEFEAAKQIADRGHAALCPFEQKWRRRHSRTRHKKQHKYPLFTRYVFAGISAWPGDYRDIIDSIEEVQGVVGVGAVPARLTESEIEWIKAICATGGDRDMQSATSVHKAIKPGEPVRIMEGSFEGKVGPLDCVLGKDAKVLIEIFNSMHLIKIPLAKIERA
jgi:transcription antitermination factor NusG